MRSISFTLALLYVFCLAGFEVGKAQSSDNNSIRVDTSRKTIRVENRDVGLRISFNGRCLIDSLWVGSKAVVDSTGAAYSGFRIGSAWYSTRELLSNPQIGRASCRERV